MPVKAKRPCTHVGCRYLQPCPVHPKIAWVKNNDVPRMRGRALQKERELFFRSYPLCAECERQCKITRATELDHIVPLSEGGQDIRENRQGLCKQCHEKKTEEEAKRGRERG